MGESPTRLSVSMALAALSSAMRCQSLATLLELGRTRRKSSVDNNQQKSRPTGRLFKNSICKRLAVVKGVFSDEDIVRPHHALVAIGEDQHLWLPGLGLFGFELGKRHDHQ